MIALDLYAGAGGWDEGARSLGLPTVGLEIWHDACVTAVRAGHQRVQCDIATYPTAPFVGRTTGLVASPPCQAWSMAGNRLGEQDKARVHELVDHYAAGGDQPGDGWADPRSHHAAQPVRWIRDLRPEWVALEQVPPVIDLWRHISDVLRRWGYSVAVQVLNAADYGVPQTRQRAILIASRTRPAVMPETTHERDPKPSLFGERLPWVSMAEALGWQGTFHNRRDSPAWVAEHGERRNRESDEPAPTITGEAHRWAIDRRTNSKGPGWRNGDAPMVPTPLVTLDRPAPTITASQGWTFTRPATTVQGDPRSGDPGHKDRAGGESQFEKGALRVTVAEAAILQSFPADYPWRGNKTSQFLQVGNAVPPQFAAAVIGTATGADWQTAVANRYDNQPAMEAVA